MLNFGKLTNEELINLLSVTRNPVVAGDKDQIGIWNRLFNKASEQLEERLDGEKEVD